MEKNLKKVLYIYIYIKGFIYISNHVNRNVWCIAVELSLEPRGGSGLEKYHYPGESKEVYS